MTRLKNEPIILTPPHQRRYTGDKLAHEKMSTSYVIRNPMKFNYTPIRMAEFQNKENTKFKRLGRRMGTLTHSPSY
jgi:hypothetical protein